MFCENGGFCATPDNCTCVGGWAGSDCTTPTCTPPCGVGQICSLPNTCVSACFQPCQNGGVCVGTDICVCLAGWTGLDCSAAICSAPCAFGVCAAPETCACSAGFTGSTCTEPICTKPCRNGGVCIAPDTCSCPANWVEDDCSQALCNGEVEGCQFGHCMLPNVCNCTTGYTGELCTVPICSKICRNGGECIAPNTCECKGGFSGIDCSEFATISSSTWQRVAPFTYGSAALLVWVALCVLMWRWRLRKDAERLARYKAEEAEGAQEEDSDSVTERCDTLVQGTHLGLTVL